MLEVDPDRVDEVVRMYRTEEILEYSLAHSDCIATELSVATHGSGTVLVTALWPDEDAYQGWLNNPWRAHSSERLADILTSATVGAGRTFSIVSTVAA